MANANRKLALDKNLEWQKCYAVVIAFDFLSGNFETEYLAFFEKKADALRYQLENGIRATSWIERI